MFINDIKDGDRVFVVDDLLSTDGTPAAICGALDGVDAEVSGIAVAIRKVGKTALNDADYEAVSLADVSVDEDGVGVY